MQTKLTKAPVVEIFCDFDGTITTFDSTDFLLEKLADPAWHEIEERWGAGEINSRECMGSQVALIKGGWRAVETALSGVHFEPTFADFVKWCKESGFVFNVVSDGIDRVIQYLLAREQIKVDHIFANHLEEVDDKLSLHFPYAQLDNCHIGVCKCKLLEPDGQPKINVVIGDGSSDFCWAKEADLLFAKSKLAKHCNEQSIQYNPFDSFLSIQATLQSWLEKASLTESLNASPS
jgi:2-hydroxy-3-keto-5-methylthiopentenyl-1-phosphate phosphatase